MQYCTVARDAVKVVQYMRNTLKFAKLLGTRKSSEVDVETTSRSQKDIWSKLRITECPLSIF